MLQKIKGKTLTMKRYVSCLTIAGSDPSGGAGIEADLKTFAALGVYGMAVITAVTAQNTLGVRSSFALPADVVEAQAEAVFDDLNPQYVKIGMTADINIICVLSRLLRKYSPKFVVLDPVVVSTSGHKLIEDSAIEAMKRELLPLVSVVTPNLPESAVLADCGELRTLEEAEACGRRILARGCKAVLVKGGHFESSPDSSDLLLAQGFSRTYAMPRVKTQNTHGTGCTLSSAIAAYSARGCGLAEAVGEAKHYLHEALQAGADVKVGEGHGPVNHFFRPCKQLFE